MALSQTDPELLRQLDDARTSGEPVHAVVKLHRTAGKAPVPSVVEEQTRRAVDRAAKTTGERPDDVHVLGRLATAYVSGSEKFLREFVEQPEVASAVANQVASSSSDLGTPEPPGSATAEPSEPATPGPRGSAPVEPSVSAPGEPSVSAADGTRSGRSAGAR